MAEKRKWTYDECMDCHADANEFHRTNPGQPLPDELIARFEWCCSEEAHKEFWEDYWVEEFNGNMKLVKLKYHRLRARWQKP